MRKHYLDYLRVIAIVAVIIIHVTASTYLKFDEIGQSNWWLSNFLNSASRFAVPLFVMISGAVLLGKIISMGDFYRKRAVRLLPPIIFWTIFYIGFSAIFFGKDILSLINGVLGSGQAYFHLWYLSMFICLMLFAPFINMFLNGNKPTSNQLFILLAVMFVFVLLNGIRSFAMNIMDLKITEWFKVFPWYIVYFIGGYYIDRYSETIKIKESFIFSLIILFIFSGIILNYYLVSAYGIDRKHGLLDNTGPMVFIITFLIFLFIKKKSLLMKKNKIISAISEASFGMYLIHPVFIEILQSQWIGYETMSFVYFPIAIVVTLLTSFYTIVLIRRIAFMRLIC